MRTFYVTDLDGTLLNSNDRINPYSIETINSLVEKGMLFTYATARSLVSASVVARGLSTQILFSRDERYNCTLQQELYRPEYFCEIMPRKATKANAILKLKALWRCDRVVSFGDAINDLSMFRISDECYAVENAVEELKAASTGVIKSNDADGVALWLQEHYVGMKVK